MTIWLISETLHGIPSHSWVSLLFIIMTAVIWLLAGVLEVLCTWRSWAVMMAVVAEGDTTFLASLASRSTASHRWFTIIQSTSFQSKVLNTCPCCTRLIMSCSELFCHVLFGTWTCHFLFLVLSSWCSGDLSEVDGRQSRNWFLEQQ